MFNYDVIIIGGSYSGLAAGMALGRAMRRVLIVDAGKPCNRQTPHSHNFLTQDGETPQNIARLAKQQVMKYDTVKFLDGVVSEGEKRGSGFEVHIQSGENYSARKLVFATGIKDIMPDIPGFSTSWGVSVLHCPYCHGYEVRHQRTGILATGDSAFELASLISGWTNDITVFTNGEAMLNEEHKAKFKQYGIEVFTEKILELENEGGVLKNVVFRDGTRVSLKAMYARLPFVQHSLIPEKLGCELTPEGYLKIDGFFGTTVPGVYACGDNASRMRTVANAVAMGTAAGMMVNRELIDEEF